MSTTPAPDHSRTFERVLSGTLTEDGACRAVGCGVVRFRAMMHRWAETQTWFRAGTIRRTARELAEQFRRAGGKRQ